LVKEEEAVRSRRKAHFFSAKFNAEDAGPLFPSSWTSSVQGNAASLRADGGHLHPRPEYKQQADLLREALRAATPVFDRRTEDGMWFRIYKLGDLEVRTTQPQHSAEEEVGAVFSTRTAAARSGGFVARAPRALAERDRVQKVTEYVERSEGGRATFVVLEAEGGGMALTEELADGTVVWKENPMDLEIRTSMAKVIRSADCEKAGVTFGDMKAFQVSQDGRNWPKASRSRRKRYVQLAFCKAVDEPRVGSGFYKKSAFTQSWARCPRTR